jgi:hypothetical protein
MLNIRVNYPTEAEELEIVARTTSTGLSEPTPVLSGEDIVRMQALVRQIPVSEDVLRHAIRIVRATRVREEGEAIKVCRDSKFSAAGALREFFQGFNIITRHPNDRSFELCKLVYCLRKQLCFNRAASGKSLWVKIHNHRPFFKCFSKYKAVGLPRQCCRRGKARGGDTDFEFSPGRCALK